MDFVFALCSSPFIANECAVSTTAGSTYLWSANRWVMFWPGIIWSRLNSSVILVYFSIWSAYFVHNESCQFGSYLVILDVHIIIYSNSFFIFRKLTIWLRFQFGVSLTSFHSSDPTSTEYLYLVSDWLTVVQKSYVVFCFSVLTLCMYIYWIF